ncbi:MAG: hypothetical protein QM498_06345 [Desulfobacterium sp.]
MKWCSCEGPVVLGVRQVLQRFKAEMATMMAISGQHFYKISIKKKSVSAAVAA